MFGRKVRLALIDRRPWRINAPLPHISAWSTRRTAERYQRSLATSGCVRPKHRASALERESQQRIGRGEVAELLVDAPAERDVQLRLHRRLGVERASPALSRDRERDDAQTVGGTGCLLAPLKRSSVKPLDALRSRRFGERRRCAPWQAVTV